MSLNWYVQLVCWSIFLTSGVESTPLEQQAVATPLYRQDDYGLSATMARSYTKRIKYTPPWQYSGYIITSETLCNIMFDSSLFYSRSSQCIKDPGQTVQLSCLPHLYRCIPNPYQIHRRSLSDPDSVDQGISVPFQIPFNSRSLPLQIIQSHISEHFQFVFTCILCTSLSYRYILNLLSPRSINLTAPSSITYPSEILSRLCDKGCSMATAKIILQSYCKELNVS